MPRDFFRNTPSLGFFAATAVCCAKSVDVLLPIKQIWHGLFIAI